MEYKALVTDIQRFAVNDGPGIRTVVFLKGCPLSCAWCHNPETKAPYPELYWKRRYCTQCGRCCDVCPEGAVNPPVPVLEAMAEDSPYHKLNRKRCTRCMQCVPACAFGALEPVGRPMGVEDILKDVDRDGIFYQTSGGGMTVSGGEPALHGVFTRDLLAQARGMGIHTCLDTSGHCETALLMDLAGHADTVLFDLKHLNGRMHKRFTGVDNGVILENLFALSEAGCFLRVRIPVVPGFNDSLEFHRAASAFLCSLPGGFPAVDLLPFHNWCQDKYAWLGLDWEYRSTDALAPAFLEIPAELYREQGLSVSIGGSGFHEEAPAPLKPDPGGMRPTGKG